VHYEEIIKGTPSDVICTVFETINTTGKRLTVFDLLVARCFPEDMNLRDMLDAALDKVFIKFFDPEGEGIAPIALPRIIALKAKETARRGDILELEPSVIDAHWDDAVDALENALELLFDRYGCFGQRFVPLVDMIAPLAVIISSKQFKHTNDQLDMIDKWYWRSVFSQYYTSATETKIQRTVRQWLSREGEQGWLENPKNEPDSVRDFSYRISILDDVSRMDNAIYRGVMSLLLSRNVRDFGPARKQAKSVPWEDIQDHHIYPKQFLAPNGLKGDKVNNIANRTPLTRSTNGAIGNTAPHVYLTDTKIVGSKLPIDAALEEHLINPKLALQPFTAEIYDKFLKDRTARIIREIEKLVSAEPIVEARFGAAS
jgi:hypothetical protein